MRRLGQELLAMNRDRDAVGLAGHNALEGIGAQRPEVVSAGALSRHELNPEADSATHSQKPPGLARLPRTQQMLITRHERANRISRATRNRGGSKRAASRPCARSRV